VAVAPPSVCLARPDDERRRRAADRGYGGHRQDVPGGAAQGGRASGGAGGTLSLASSRTLDATGQRSRASLGRLDQPFDLAPAKVLPVAVLSRCQASPSYGPVPAPPPYFRFAPFIVLSRVSLPPIGHNPDGGVPLRWSRVEVQLGDMIRYSPSGMFTIFRRGKIVAQPAVSGLAMKAFQRARWIQKA
jgi:hypothetical protein